MRKTCIECNVKESLIGRRYCEDCFRNRKRLQAKNHPRYTYLIVCAACDKQFKAWRKESKLCPNCYRESRTRNKKNDYVYVSMVHRKESENQAEHRRLAELLLNRKLSYNEIVHHIDNNPKNNAEDNLLVMSRANHNRLHMYLNTQRAILVKANNENFVNCWNTLIVPMTTAWLETTSVKVIKLWEIGQSAAKLVL